MSYSRYFSPAQIESDQKDLIISQLKADVFEMKRNQSDYYELTQQLKSLEHRYNMLNDEKNRSELEYQQQTDLNFKNIANLRTDIETLQSQLKEKQIDLQESKADNVTLSDLTNQRQQEIQKLKNEIGQTNEQNNHFKDEKVNLNQITDNLKNDKKKIVLSIDNATREIDELMYKNNDQEKLLKELDFEKNRIQKQNNQLQNSIQSSKLELKNKTDQLIYAEQQRSEGQKALNSLEKDLIELEGVNEKTKQEVFQNNKNYYQEQNKNAELETKFVNLENVLKNRIIHYNDLKDTISNLKQENSDVMEINSQLSYDLEALKRHIEILQEKNNQLSDELQLYSEQDEMVRQILNRQARVKDIKLRSEDRMRKALNKVQLIGKIKASSPNLLHSQQQQFSDNIQQNE